MAIQDLYNKTATILKRNVTSTNDYGEAVVVEADGTSFECALQPDDGDFNIEEGGKVVSSTHRVYCDIGVDIEAGDYIRFGIVKYLVLAVLDDAGRGNHYKVMLRLVS